MTEQRVHKIKGALLLPLAVIVFCLLVLSLSAWVTAAGWVERIFLTFLTSIAGLFFVERLTRHLFITQEGLSFRKFFRQKRLAWEEITEVSALTLGRRRYLLLTTLKGFIFFSNSWTDFTGLVKEVSSQTEASRQDRESLAKQDTPDTFLWQAAYFWSAAILVALLTVFRLQQTLP